MPLRHAATRHGTPICVGCGLDTATFPEGSEVHHGFAFCEGCVPRVRPGGDEPKTPADMENLFRILDL